MQASPARAYLKETGVERTTPTCLDPGCYHCYLADHYKIYYKPHTVLKQRSFLDLILTRQHIHNLLMYTLGTITL